MSLTGFFRGCMYGGLLITAVPVHAGIIYATNSAGALLSFDSATPGTIISSTAVSGLGGASLIGIDFRPANSTLYGVSTAGNVFTINTNTGVATFVAPFSVAVNGSNFGFDFNPVADRLRTTSNTDQNLRTNVDNGAVTVDTPLSYAPGDANAGANPNIVGSAYTNSFSGAATTALYGIDSTLGVLALQNPPNNGTLNTVGSLGVTTTANVGFDIAFPGNFAFAALQAVGGFSSLYSINLSTGAATRIGAIGTNQVITGLAAAPVPEPATVLLLLAGLGILAAARGKLRTSRSGDGGHV